MDAQKYTGPPPPYKMCDEVVGAKALQIGVRHSDARTDKGVVLDKGHIGRKASTLSGLGNVLEKEGRQRLAFDALGVGIVEGPFRGGLRIEAVFCWDRIGHQNAALEAKTPFGRHDLGHFVGAVGAVGQAQAAVRREKRGEFVRTVCLLYTSPSPRDS